jgi:hypothetical protein
MRCIRAILKRQKTYQHYILHSYIIDEKMTKFKSGGTTQLHYALTESECNACGSHLEWQPDFKDIGRP